jgi:hypothetical protein
VHTLRDTCLMSLTAQLALVVLCTEACHAEDTASGLTSAGMVGHWAFDEGRHDLGKVTPATPNGRHNTAPSLETLRKHWIPDDYGMTVT